MIVKKRTISYLIIIPSILAILLIGIILMHKDVAITIKNISYPAGLVLIIAGLLLIIASWLRSTKATDERNFKRPWEVIAISFTPFIILTILFAVWQPFIWKWMFGEAVPEIQMTPRALATLMALVVALLALGVAAFGILTYTIVSDRIKTVADKEVMQETKGTVTWLSTILSYSLWNLSSCKDIGELQNQFVEQAIEVAKRVHDAITPRLDQEDPTNQLIIGSIRNNLASYLAHVKKEGELAKTYARYIKSISQKFPEVAETWEQTYREVFEAFPA
jgi:hypothetical protein